MVHLEGGERPQRQDGHHAGHRRKRAGLQLPLGLDAAALDPRQTYILAGPYFRLDGANGMVGVFSARPIPPGVTVIAKPSRPDASVATSTREATAATASERRKFNPDAAPFYPTQQQILLPSDGAFNLLKCASPSADSAVAKTGAGASPCVLLFSSAHPEGRVLPVRQPQPPVYFQHAATSTLGEQPQDDQLVQLPYDYPHLHQFDYSGDATETRLGDGLRLEHPPPGQGRDHPK